MPRERTITKLELSTAHVAGQPGWVKADWQRSDGSQGAAFAHFRAKKAEHWAIDSVLINFPTAALLRDVPVARMETAVNANPKIREWIESGLSEEIVADIRRAVSKRRKLEQPATRRLDDDFYRQVADAYTDAVAPGLQPAKTLAADSDATRANSTRRSAPSKSQRLSGQGRTADGVRAAPAAIRS